MKVFMLGCANERGEVVSMKAFLNHDLAQSQMEGEYENEVEYMEDRGSDIETQECGTDFATMVIDGNEEFSYHWSIFSKDIDAAPSDIITALHKSMWEDIDRIAQAPVPGYSSCRPAAIDLRGEQFKKLRFSTGEELVSVEAYVPVGGLAVIVKCADGETRPVLVYPQSFDTDEILELHTVITNAKHPARAFSPYWLMDNEWHKTLMDVLNKTDEEYKEFINNNPKNKKQENDKR